MRFKLTALISVQGGCYTKDTLVVAGSYSEAIAQFASDETLTHYASNAYSVTIICERETW